MRKRIFGSILALSSALILGCGGGSESTISDTEALDPIVSKTSGPLGLSRKRFKPEPAPAPVTEPAPAPTTVAEWEPLTRYIGGEVVQYLGIVYTAKVVGDSVWNVNSAPNWTPTYWTVGTTVISAPASTTAPAPAPTATPFIAVQDYPGGHVQVGNYWWMDGVWGATGLTKGTYVGLYGTTYEQQVGVSPKVGLNGEVAGRMTWKFPTGTTEVKSYPSFLFGNKPGLAHQWTGPGGEPLYNTDWTRITAPAYGPTPNSFFPLQLPVASLNSYFSYKHNVTPNGRGHLSYDIWLQNTPVQQQGFNVAREITHEIMIPLTNWGNYGRYGFRNPGWYDHDVVIDGRLFHVYAAKGADGQLRPDFFGGWKFIVFQPAVDIPTDTQLDLAKFINYVATRRDLAGTPWAYGTEYAVSVELGVETVEGTGDMTLFNYRVWR